MVEVNFSGPLYTKDNPDKAFVLLITCAITSSIYLELIPNFNTETLTMVFKRLMARGGILSAVYSSNAHTFKRLSDNF